MLKYLYYLIKNPMIDFTFYNQLPQAVFRPLYISKYKVLNKVLRECIKMCLPLRVVNLALMYGIGNDKPYLDEECNGIVQLYQLDPIVVKKEEIEKYSKCLPIEVSFKYVNHRFYLTGVKRIRRM